MTRSGDWLRERSLWQVLGVYLAGAWVAFEVVATVSDTLELPGWIPRGTLALIAIGLPIVISAVLLRRREGLLTLRNALIGGALAFATLFGVGALIVAFRDGPEVAAPGPAAAGPSIAVLPAYSPGDATTVAAGMNALLSAGIDGVAGWRAVSPRTVQARWDERVTAGTADEATSLAVGLATGATYAVLPTVLVLPNEIQLTAEIFDLSELSRITVVESEGPPDSLVSIAEGLSVQILNQVLRGEREVTLDLAQVTSGSPEALLAFLDGEVAFRAYELPEARDALLRAVSLDSAFALAHYRLAEIYQWGSVADAGESGRHMSLAARHADRLAPREAGVARARTATAPGSDGRLRAEMLRDVVASYPDDPTALYWLGESLLHYPGTLARTSEIDSVFQRAVELDPENAALYPHTLHLTFTYRGDSALARTQAERFTRLAGRVEGPPNVDADPRGALPAWDLVFGDSTARARAESWILDSDRPRDRALAVLGHVRAPMYDQAVEWLLTVLDNPVYPAPATENFPFGAGETAAPHFMFQRNLHWKGRVGRALPLLARLNDRAGSGLSELISAWMAGVPVPDSALAAELGAHRIDDEMTLRRGVGTVLFANAEGRLADVDRGLEILARRIEGSDNDPPDWWLALQGALAWQDGERERAEELLSDTFYTGWPMQWAYARLLMDQGRWGEAESVLATGAWGPSYFAFGDLPISHYHLGRVYEELGEPRKAAASYGYFVEQWSDADPPAQGMVEESRTRLEALLREIG